MRKDQKILGGAELNFLCSYADTNIMYAHLWDIFEEHLNKQFDAEGNIVY